jgi:hypothetical protein
MKIFNTMFVLSQVPQADVTAAWNGALAKTSAPKVAEEAAT